MKAAIAILCATALLGCGDERALAVPAWSLEAPPGSPAREITLPTKLELDPSVPRYRLQRDVALPPELRGRTLTLVIPQIEARTALSVAGQPIEPLDDPGPGFRGDRAPRWRIDAARTTAPTLPLEIVVEHGTPQSERLSTVPRLSDTPFGDARFRAMKTLNHTSSAIALGGLLGMFVTYAVLWLLDRRRTAYGYLAIAALGGSVSPLLWLGATQYLFGRHELLVMAVSLALAGLGVLASTHARFALPLPSRRWWGALAALVVLTVISAFVPAIAGLTGTLALVFDYVAIAAIGVALARVSRLRPRPPDVGVMSLALLALAVSTLPTALWRFGVDSPVTGFVLTPLGMVLFLLIHSVTLSRAHVTSMRTTDALNVELAARIDQLEAKNREVSVLNVELRRQVADRSAKLAEALARIEGVTSANRGFAEGEVVDERYRVVRALGAGGMGAVYEVERLADDRHLALKILRGETSGPALARFAREAEIAARIHHPNLVSVVDVDVATTGSLYIVMELVDGPTLESMRDVLGHPERARPIVAQIAEGLAALHAEHVIHRDLKPGNVLIDRDGTAKISDFGISALREAVDPLAATRTPEDAAPRSDLTQTGAMLGTPLYMAPELWRGADRANEASDVFSLGLVAYVALTGAYPFEGPPLHVVGAGRGLPAPAPIPGVSDDVARVVLGCLSVDPVARPTAREVAAILRAN